MRTLVLVRGLPGSGKTTFARTLGSKYPTWSADDYFAGPGGAYLFDPTRLGEAHRWCQARVEESMEWNLEQIFVANTFTTEKEMKPYQELAEKHGYVVFSVIVENRHGGRSVHGVPDETLASMKSRFSVRL